MVKTKVGDIMTRNFVSVKPETNLIDCAKAMVKNRVGSLILAEKQKLIGMITQDDIVWALTKKGQKNLKEVQAIDISPKKIITIKPSANVDEAVNRMRKLKFRRLPVTVDGNVIGMLTLKDILKIEPGLSEIATQRITDIRELSQKLKRARNPREFEEGICNECGNMDILYNLDGRIVCEDCMENM